jgi:hypothetical protein
LEIRDLHNLPHYIVRCYRIGLTKVAGILPQGSLEIDLFLKMG